MTADSGVPAMGRLQDPADKYRIFRIPLVPHLLCSRTAVCDGIYAIELTAPQLSDPSVALGRGPEPPRPNVSSTSHVYMELPDEEPYRAFREG